MTLTWQASNSPEVTGYRVYRRAASSGNYSLLNASPTPSLNYVDLDVQGGQTLVYYVTAVDARLNQSQPTPEVTVVIPQ